jgi:hypothetical protein
MWHVAHEQPAAAQGQQFVKTIVANCFHYRKTGIGLDSLFFTSTIDNDKLRHRLFSKRGDRAPPCSPLVRAAIATSVVWQLPIPTKNVVQEKIDGPFCRGDP